MWEVIFRDVFQVICLGIVLIYLAGGLLIFTWQVLSPLALGIVVSWLVARVFVWFGRMVQAEFSQWS